MKDSHTRDTILSHIEVYGIHNKDDVVQTNAQHRRSDISKTIRGRYRKTIDLHGLTTNEAELDLARAVEECRKKGVTELLIIHGWGQHSDPAEGGVLNKMVRDNLEHSLKPMIRSWKTALAKDGGEGATLVTIR